MLLFFAWLVLVRGDESCDSERNSLLQTSNRGHAQEILAYNTPSTVATPVPTPDPKCWVKFWEHTNYKGNWKIFDSSEASLDKFQMDNQMSSVELKPGCKVTIYNGKNYSDDETTFTSNTANLVGVSMGTSNWNDKMSSFKLQPMPCWVKFWEHIHYQGESKVFDSNEASLEQFKMERRASSIELKPGCTVTIYKCRNYVCDQITFISNVENLKTQQYTASNAKLDNWNDQMNSFKLSPTPPCWVQFWNKPLYLGKSIVFDSEEASLDKFTYYTRQGAYIYDYLGEAIKESWKYQASSFKLKPGCKLTIYFQDFEEKSFTSDAGNLSNVSMEEHPGWTWNKKMSSFKLSPQSKPEPTPDPSA